MMRIDLPQPLKAGESFTSSRIGLSTLMTDYCRIPNLDMSCSLGDGNSLYTMWQSGFPRMAVYSDFDGWQNKQFLSSEFA
jgi:hypothetical protein